MAVKQILQSGTEIAQINVDGKVVSIYAPTPQSVSVTQTQTEGAEIARINVGNASTKLYAPTTTVTQTLTEGTEIGEVNGTKLYAPTGGGSDVTVTPITTTGTNIANIAVDGTTYNLFAPTSGGSSGHNYSTTEQVIGTWIDGSTVYEKTQYGGITFSSRGTWYDTDITGIDKIISVEGSINRDGEPIGIGYWNSSVTSCWILRNSTLKMCMQAMASGETYTLNSITVQYTKTS